MRIRTFGPPAGHVKKRAETREIRCRTAARVLHNTADLRAILKSALQEGDRGMRTFTRIICGAALLTLLPAAASAQTSSIAGTVKDTTGAVMPGVTVEATSPALIEKVRSAVTD